TQKSTELNQNGKIDNNKKQILMDIDDYTEDHITKKIKSLDS
ncbi:11794_t:CDS:1, partial [Gigaspora margarita]